MSAKSKAKEFIKGVKKSKLPTKVTKKKKQ